MSNESKTRVLLGFDYSLNKPAATLVVGRHAPKFFIWPLSLSAPEREKWGILSDVSLHERNLPPISKGKLVESDLTLIHTRRSLDLARYVVQDVREHIHACGCTDTGIAMYVCSEGYSFASKGNATLDLATYKGVLLSEIYREFTDVIEWFGTYSPISIKSVAGCATKEMRGVKEGMINAFTKEILPSPSAFQKAVVNGDLKAKKNYIPCVDDVVDSYWALRTMCVKEHLPWITDK